MCFFTIFLHVLVPPFLHACFILQFCLNRVKQYEQIKNKTKQRRWKAGHLDPTKNMSKIMEHHFPKLLGGDYIKGKAISVCMYIQLTSLDYTIVFTQLN